MLLLFRSLTGIGMGGFHVTLTLLAEFVAPSLRGRLLMSTVLFWTVGEAIAQDDCSQHTWL